MHKDLFCYRGKSKLGIGLFIHELLREPLILVQLTIIQNYDVLLALVFFTFCTGVTLFALVLYLNCTALSQSESSNFVMYKVIIVKNYSSELKRKIATYIKDKTGYLSIPFHEIKVIA